jgi:hypothetical protein
MGQITNRQLTESLENNLDVEFCPIGQVAQGRCLLQGPASERGRGATESWLDALVRCRPDSEPPSRWKAKFAGVRRFVEDGWHDRAIALGWSTHALYGCDDAGAHGAVWLIEDDRVLFVTDNQIMACDKNGFARPIYRGVSYGESR